MISTRFIVGFLAFVGLALLNFTQSESGFVIKALALGGDINSPGHASNGDVCESPWDSYNSNTTSGMRGDGSDSSGGAVIDHGNIPDKHCPIWNVQIIIAGGEWAHVCTTGGGYKCFEGSCPHGA